MRLATLVQMKGGSGANLPSGLSIPKKRKRLADAELPRQPQQKLSRKAEAYSTLDSFSEGELRRLVGKLEVAKEANVATALLKEMQKKLIDYKLFQGEFREGMGFFKYLKKHAQR